MKKSTKEILFGVAALVAAYYLYTRYADASGSASSSASASSGAIDD